MEFCVGRKRCSASYSRVNMEESRGFSNCKSYLFVVLRFIFYFLKLHIIFPACVRGHESHALGG